MAIPTLMRKSDFPTIDFTATNAAATFITVLRTALTTFGWTQEFEDTNVNSVVFSNGGSGYMIKFSEHSNNQYVLIETAQSWSDIDTPVNALFSQFYFVQDIKQPNGDLAFLGDDARFYWSTISDVNSDTARVRIFFAGDIVPFKETDPYVFIAVGHTATPVSGTISSSSNLAGLIINPSEHVTSTDTVTSNFAFYGNAQGDLGQVDGSLISPGRPNEFHRDINPASILAEQPTILTPTYCIQSSIDANVNGTKYANFVRGQLPGLHVSLFPSQLVVEAPYLSKVTVGGVQCLLVGSRGNAKSEFLLAMNDWSALI